LAFTIKLLYLCVSMSYYCVFINIITFRIRTIKAIKSMLSLCKYLQLENISITPQTYLRNWWRKRNTVNKRDSTPPTLIICWFIYIFFFFIEKKILFNIRCILLETTTEKLRSSCSLYYVCIRLTWVNTRQTTMCM